MKDVPCLLSSFLYLKNLIPELNTFVNGFYVSAYYSICQPVDIIFFSRYDMSKAVIIEV